MNKYNKKLAIAIPTFNRSEVIEENLQLMLPDLRLHSIPVYISDDSSDMGTQVVIKRLQSQYEHVYYRHNQPSLGHDGNFFATLAMPDCDYVWYMGDSLYFQPGVISEIIEVLDGGIDFCFVNYRANDFSCKHVDSVHDFLVDRTWYLTLTGATIYGCKPRTLILSEEKKMKWRNFVQLGLVLEYCTRNEASMYWYGKPALCLNKKKKSSYWATNVFSVFVEDWSNLIRSFQGYFSESEITKIIKSHAINTELFNLRHLIFLRVNGGLSTELLRKHKVNFCAASPISPFLAYLIALVPVTMWQCAVACNRILKR